MLAASADQTATVANAHIFDRVYGLGRHDEDDIAAITAVAAIIALITLRKLPQGVDGKAAGGSNQGGAGEFQFGGGIFAFAFLVIAALIIPRDDIMRFADFM
mgnify:CR=1 FL=1